MCESEIALIWISLDFIHGKSTLVQVQQATTRANVDPYQCRHMESLGRNELNLEY